ncbi:hypothetical protein [Micromonospora sp. SH-82]
MITTDGSNRLSVPVATVVVADVRFAASAATVGGTTPFPAVPG